MFLTDLVVVFAVAAAIVFAFGHAKLPSVVGLLVAGVLVGPYGLSLVGDVKVVEMLAEIGVVVLLFTVGLEFSLSRLLVMLPLMGRIGLPQVVGTTTLVAAAAGEVPANAAHHPAPLFEDPIAAVVAGLACRGSGAPRGSIRRAADAARGGAAAQPRTLPDDDRAGLPGHGGDHRPGRPLAGPGRLPRGTDALGERIWPSGVHGGAAVSRHARGRGAATGLQRGRQACILMSPPRRPAGE